MNPLGTTGRLNFWKANLIPLQVDVPSVTWPRTVVPVVSERFHGASILRLRKTTLDCVWLRVECATLISLSCRAMCSPPTVDAHCFGGLIGLPGANSRWLKNLALASRPIAKVLFGGACRKRGRSCWAP